MADILILNCCRNGLLADTDNFFVTIADSVGKTAERGDKRVVKLLLENGALPNFEDEGGQTPLSRAVESGSAAVVQLLFANKEVKKDYKYNFRFFSSPWGWDSDRFLDDRDRWLGFSEKFETWVSTALVAYTVITIAEKKGDEGIAKLLLENGASPDFEDESGRTPLSRAAARGHKRVVKLLLENGARPDFEDESGQTP
ncbi:Ankyrin repeat-containing domain protein [Elaphomyces granulatus]